MKTFPLYNKGTACLATTLTDEADLGTSVRELCVAQQQKADCSQSAKPKLATLWLSQTYRFHEVTLAKMKHTKKHVLLQRVRTIRASPLGANDAWVNRYWHG